MEFVLRSNVTVHQPVTWRDVDSVFDVHFFVNRQNRAMRTNSLDPRIFRLLCCVFALTSLATLLVGCQTPEISRNDGGNDSDVPTGAVDAVSDRADVGAPVEDARSDQLDAPSIEVDSGGPAGLFARPIAPLSLGDVSLRRPTLRWELPAATEGAVVDLCRDRACTMVIETLRAPGTSVRPTMPLPPNSVVFWRLRATRGVDVSATFSPTWLFHVPATDNSSGIDTSTNAHLDVNGDGFDDVVVGSPFASPGGLVRAGTASVFHGSAMGIPVMPNRVLEGASSGDQFGLSVASAGDVNGDGFGDLVVGANAASPGGRTGAGTASVFHGSAMGVAMCANRVLEGAAASDRFGVSVASAGDINGDGFGDLVVGANTASPGGRMSAGTASVFHGSVTGVSMMPTRILEGVRASDFFGYSVASTGDINGDGFGDLVVGAYRADPGGRVDAGAVSVFHGSVTGVPMMPTRVLEGGFAGDLFGDAVASAGDLNGDGFGDLVVEAFAASPGGRMAAGTVSVFHGSVMGLPMMPTRVLEGDAVGDSFGWSLASAGDLNGDGFGDLVVGAIRASPGGRVSAGTASVFHGSATGVPMMPTRILEGVVAGDHFGYMVARAGDVNGDGFGDLVVGANTASPGGRMSAGTTSVFHGSLIGVPMMPTRMLEGVVAGDQFGFSVASAAGFHGQPRARWFASGRLDCSSPTATRERSTRGPKQRATRCRDLGVRTAC